MRVLLIQSPLGHPYRNVFPHALCLLATVLERHGHAARVWDPNLESEPTRRLDEIVRDFGPEVIGVSLRNVDTVRLSVPFLFHLAFRDFVAQTKKAFGRIPIIAGGAGFSIFARPLMELCPEIDYGFYLEAEESLPELLDNWDRPQTVPGLFYRRGGQVLFSGERPLPDLAGLPTPDRSYLDIGRYTSTAHDVGVETKRGCALRCAYCSYPRLNGRKYRLRPPVQVVDEIEELHRRHGLENFSFIDSVFDLPREHCLRVCRELARRGLGIRWSAWFSGVDFTQELYDRTYEAGCELYGFSPDGYTPAAIEGLGKPLSHDDILRIRNLFRGQNNDAKVSINFFANSPGTGWSDLVRTVLFCFTTRITLSHRLQRVGMDHIRILPDTPLYDTALAKGVLSPETNLLPADADEFHALFYREPGSRLRDLALRALGSLSGKGYAPKQ